MNHLSKREQKEFIHFAERENGRINPRENEKSWRFRKKTMGLKCLIVRCAPLRGANLD